MAGLFNLDVESKVFDDVALNWDDADYTLETTVPGIDNPASIATVWGAAPTNIVGASFATTSFIEIGVGNLAGHTYGTVVGVCRATAPPASGDGSSLVQLRSNVPNNLSEPYLSNPSGSVFLSYAFDATADANVAWPSGTGWRLVVFAKGTGTVAPSYWVYDFNSATWSIDNVTSGQTVPDATRTLGTYRIGTEFSGASTPGSGWIGEIAAVAVFKNRKLTDAEVKALVSGTSVPLSGLSALSPTSLVTNLTATTSDTASGAAEVTRGGITTGTASPLTTTGTGWAATATGTVSTNVTATIATNWGPSNGTAAPVQSVATSTNNNVITRTFASPLTAGNTIIVGVAGRAAFSSVTDTDGRTYTQLATSGTGPSITLLAAQVGTGGTTPTVTYTGGSSDFVVLGIAEISGLASSAWTDGTPVTANGASADPSIGPTSAATVAAMGFGFVWQNGGSVIDQTAGQTAVWEFDGSPGVSMSHLASYKNVAIGATYTAQAHYPAGSDNYWGVAALLKITAVTGWNTSANGTVTAGSGTNWPGTIATNWGTWTATAAGTVSETATISTNWGSWATSPNATVNRTATIASSWGTWTATAAATVNRPATIATSWGGWTATATATVSETATISTSWGTWTATATGAVTEAATIATNWGTWSASATASTDHTASATTNWGTWTATANASLDHPATISSSWGTWAATGTATGDHPATINTNWGTWDASARGDIPGKVAGDISTVWTTWTATATALTDHNATITDNWGTWVAAGIASIKHDAQIATNWGTWTATAHGHVTGIDVGTVLNEADALFLGALTVDAVYVGTTLVWPP